jgi:hypothetical protein
MKNAALYKFRERRRTKQTQPNSKPLSGHASLSYETKHFTNGVHPIYEPPQKKTDSKKYVTTCEYLRASAQLRPLRRTTPNLCQSCISSSRGDLILSHSPCHHSPLCHPSDMSYSDTLTHRARCERLAM